MHVLLAGMTMSGKTTLARAMCAQYVAAGVNAIVLDPLADPRWPTEYRTSSQDVFLEWYWQNEGVMAFLDEGGESVGRYNLAMQRTATRGRHMGHVNHYIVQRVTQLAPIVRDQCSKLYLFCSSRKDGDTLAEEWNRPELAECSKLSVGEYIFAVKMGTISTHSTRGKPNESDSSSSGRGNRSRRPSDASAEEVSQRSGGDARTGEGGPAADGPASEPPASDGR